MKSIVICITIFPYFLLFVQRKNTIRLVKVGFLNSNEINIKNYSAMSVLFSFPWEVLDDIVELLKSHQSRNMSGKKGDNNPEC